MLGKISSLGSDLFCLQKPYSCRDMWYLAIAIDWYLTQLRNLYIYVKTSSCVRRERQKASLLYQSNRGIAMFQYGNPLYTHSSALSRTGCAMAKSWAGKMRKKGDAIQSCPLPENISSWSIFQSWKPVPFMFFQVLASLKRERSEEQTAHATGSIFPPSCRGLWQTPIHHPSVIW